MFDLAKPDGGESLEQHLVRAAGDFVSSWGVGLPLFIDFSRYAPDQTCANGRHACEHFFECARQLKLKAIPVAGPESHRGPGTKYIQAVAAIARADQRGAAIRIPLESITGSASLATVAESIIATLSLPTKMIDLFIDLEAVNRLPRALQGIRPIAAVVDEAIGALDGMEFRNLVIVGCSLPEQVGKAHDWNPVRVHRTELGVWSELSQRRRTAGLRYGDYGIAYVFEEDPDGPVLPPSRIRLSTESEYVLHRAPRDEYRKLCAHVITTPDFDRSLQVWGAQEIMQGGTPGPGAPREWVARDTNLHIERTRRIVEAELGRLGLQEGLAFAEPEPAPYLQVRLDDSPG
jgi:hypothetical protein